ncbi:hypothetical protein GIW57_17750 [Stenotrophomonas sp. PA-6-5C]|nr:hypothetical protein [Stenotrophomonas sp. PA-6-5C]
MACGGTTTHSAFTANTPRVPAASRSCCRAWSIAQGLCRIPPSCKLLTPCDTLSRNEREVIRLVLDGLTVSEIALHRHRSVKTVSTQKVAALRKLGLRNDAEIFAMRQQLEAL